MDNSKKNKQKGRPKNKSKSTVFKDRLNKLYGDSGDNQEKAAEALGTTRQTFGNWLAGRNEPDLEKMIKIADYYNVSTDYLLGLTEHKTKNEDEKYVLKITGLSEKALDNIRVLCGTSLKILESNLSHNAVMFLLESEQLIEIARCLSRAEAYYDILEPSEELAKEVFLSDGKSMIDLAASALVRSGYGSSIKSNLTEAVIDLFNGYKEALDNGKHQGKQE